MDQNFYEARTEILKIRADYLSKTPSCFNGNTKERSNYIENLTKLCPELSPYQRDLLIGLNLSDSSLDINAKKTTARMKIQLTNRKQKFLMFVKQSILEYCGNDNQLYSPKSGREMTQFNTLSTPQILKIADLFKSENESDLKERGNVKAINPRLVNELTPIAIAFWYCGDGGIRNGSNNQGKAMTLSSNGFSKQDHFLLIEGLKTCGITGELKLDNKNNYQYRIDIPGKHYDDFIRIIGPHIHHEYHYKVPDGRREGSKYGLMTSECRDLLLGSQVPSMLFS